MKNYKQPSKTSETVQPKAAKQANADSIISEYKNNIQRKAAEEDELLQGKFDMTQLKSTEEDELLQGKFNTTQLQGKDEDELLQGKFKTTQLKSTEEDELLQGKFSTAQLKAEEEPLQKKKENNTGLPDNLKSGVENLSGYAMDDVKVHYNSAQPAEMQAHAYAQGTDIHVAPGQEQHLPHEAWHVAQQKQGRVKPTMQMKGKVNVNDDAGLENEADVMGAKALQMKEKDNFGLKENNSLSSSVAQLQVFQKHNGKWYTDLDPDTEYDTQQEALDYEQNMPVPDPITGGRAPTLFTFMSTKSHNKLSSRGIPQGPHTVGHAALSRALFESEGKIDIKHVISEQVITPEEWRDIVIKEFDGKIEFDGESEVSLKLIRAYNHYNGLYQELMRCVRGESTENKYDLIEELIQLHPYTVYKFTDPSSVNKKDLKYKGENSDLSNPKNIDHRGKFKDSRNYQETIDNRLSLLDYDYNPSEEDSDSFSYSSDESMEDDSYVGDDD